MPSQKGDQAAAAAAAAAAPSGSGAAASSPANEKDDINPDTGKPYFVEPPPRGSAKERVVMSANEAKPEQVSGTAAPAPAPASASAAAADAFKTVPAAGDTRASEEVFIRGQKATKAPIVAVDMREKQWPVLVAQVVRNSWVVMEESDMQHRVSHKQFITTIRRHFASQFRLRMVCSDGTWFAYATHSLTHALCVG